MNFKDIKIGMKLKLIKRKRKTTYDKLKIREIKEVMGEYRNDSFTLSSDNENGDGFFVNKELACCWEPVINSLKSFLNTKR